MSLKRGSDRLARLGHDERALAALEFELSKDQRPSVRLQAHEGHRLNGAAARVPVRVAVVAAVVVVAVHSRVMTSCVATERLRRSRAIDWLIDWWIGVVWCGAVVARRKRVGGPHIAQPPPHVPTTRHNTRGNMARNEEKAQSLLNRWTSMKQDFADTFKEHVRKRLWRDRRLRPSRCAGRCSRPLTVFSLWLCLCCCSIAVDGRISRLNATI